MISPGAPPPAAADDRLDIASVRPLISQLTQALASTVCLRNDGDSRPPLTFADIVRTGAFFCKVISSLNPESGGTFTQEELQFVEETLTNISHPEKLEELLIRRVESGAENAQELAGLRQAVEKTMQQPFNMRQFLQRVIRESIPPNAPGRKRKIQDEDRPKLLARAEELRPAVVALGQIKKASPNRPLAEALEYLKADHPDACDYLLKHIKQLEIVLDDGRLIDRAKTLASAARIIADAMAGAETDLSARYSIQIVEEERRAARRRGMKRRISQKM